ncbi:hypothetical protein INR49_012929, partial [Caranx melampygus]
MELLLLILLSFFAALIGGLYLLGVFRQRRPGEPPLDKGLIPWLGHFLDFSRNTLEFLEKMQQKHGDIFTIQLGGFYYTLLQDPLSFGAVAKESPEKMSARQVLNHVLHRLFGYVSMTEDRHIMRMSINKHLTGAGLEVITQSMMANFQTLMLHNTGSGADQSTWIEDGLFMFCCNFIFRAGYLSLFGNVPNISEESEEKAKEKDKAESEALFHKFYTFDQFFPKLSFGTLPPKERLEAKGLTDFFSDTLSMQKIHIRDNISRFVCDIHDAKKEVGMSELMINKYMFVLLWASQVNTGPASFWLLLFLMKHPEAMAAVKEEVDKVLKESEQEVRQGGPLVNLTYEMMKKTPVLDSTIEESLRLTTAPLVTRAVLQDTTLKMADGREYFIRKGDRISMFPYTAVQTDPEIHPDPHSFKYDRFLNPDGSKKTDFYKAGKKVKYYSMPFGVGAFMCPGRFLATCELKQFVFLMLVFFEFELKNPDEKMVEGDRGRMGFGSMHPIKDIQIRYRLRNQTTIINSISAANSCMGNATLLTKVDALIGGLYLLGVFRQRRPGEPPLDKGLIPWLGHFFDFSRNTLEFLEKMQQKHAGYLSLFGNAPNTSEESEEKVKEKDKAESEALFRKFYTFEQLFPKLALGILPPKEIVEAKSLIDFFSDTLSMQKIHIRDNISRFVYDIHEAKKENGMSESMINKYMFVLLWASQVNTGPASFWLLLFLIRHPEAMAAVKEEVDKVLKESGQEVQQGGPLVNLTYEMMKKTPVLDSTIEESLRLTTAPLVARAVLQDTTLKMADGREYFIRKGDRIAMFPYTAVQTNPEIHPDPHSFKYDRFLNPDGSKKTDFYKAGKKVKYYNMPFGVGAFTCPGRFLAICELKQFVFLMLVFFEFELKNPDEKMVEGDPNRMGFGSMHPIKDIQIRYRLRNQT